MLSLRSIEKSYPLAGGQLPVLKGIDLIIEQGEMVAIMGSSGSGKSTLLNVLGLLDNFDAWLLPPRRGGHVGIIGTASGSIPQSLLGLCLPVLQSHRFQKRLSRTSLSPLFYQKIPRRERQKRALAMLDRMGMGDRANHLPSELSGGQKQRVAMARALITTPRVILADEPTGALDSVTSNEVMDVLREVNSTGITVIIVTHEADIAARCDRTIRLKDGRIIEDGNSSEVVEPTAHRNSPLS